MRQLAVLAAVLGAMFVEGATAAPNCSRSSTWPTTVEVQNQTRESVILYWVDERCEEVHYGEIPPGGGHLQPTYNGHVWRMRHAEKLWTLREVTASTVSSTFRLRALWASRDRSGGDEPDDNDGAYQIHVMYVVAADGVDRQLDENGTVRRTIAAADRWLVGQTGGPRLRWDTYEGALDVSFVRLQHSTAALRSAGVYLRDWMEREFTDRNLLRPNKIYLVFYDGGDGTEKCGGAAWPPEVLRQVVALYLQGTPVDAPPCAQNPFAATLDTTGYWEMSALHEVLHALGLVPRCAPNHTLAGHVSDDPTDLMYQGDKDWWPSVLDVGRDDYFGHGRSDCADLARSMFLDPLPPNAVLPPLWP